MAVENAGSPVSTASSPSRYRFGRKSEKRVSGSSPKVSSATQLLIDRLSNDVVHNNRQCAVLNEEMVGQQVAFKEALGALDAQIVEQQEQLACRDEEIACLKEQLQSAEQERLNEAAQSKEHQQLSASVSAQLARLNDKLKAVDAEKLMLLEEQQILKETVQDSAKGSKSAADQIADLQEQIQELERSNAQLTESLARADNGSRNASTALTQTLQLLDARDDELETTKDRLKYFEQKNVQLAEEQRTLREHVLGLEGSARAALVSTDNVDAPPKALSVSLDPARSLPVQLRQAASSILEEIASFRDRVASDSHLAGTSAKSSAQPELVTIEEFLEPQTEHPNRPRRGTV